MGYFSRQFDTESQQNTEGVELLSSQKDSMLEEDSVSSSELENKWISSNTLKDRSSSEDELKDRPLSEDEQKMRKKTSSTTQAEDPLPLPACYSKHSN